MDKKEFPEQPHISFKETYLTDTRYMFSSIKEKIDKLNIGEKIRTVSEMAAKDLKITTPFSVSIAIPSESTPGSIIPTLGIGGRAIGTSEIKLWFDINHPNVVESLDSYQERQAVHEVNHLKRGNFFSSENRTLADAIISEGLATHYEEFWGGVYKPTPWGNNLDDEQIKIEWEKVQPELSSTKYNHKEWFFGQNKKHPVWIGYTLGKAIVGSYFELHPDVQMSDLIKVPTTEIIQNSGFK